MWASRLSRTSWLAGGGPGGGGGGRGGDGVAGGRLGNPAGHRGGLLHPGRHLRLVEIVLVDVDPARVLARASGWNGPQRRASEEGHLNVVGKDVEPQEPAPAPDAIEGRVPLHGLAYIGHVAHDERVEAAPDVAV